VVVMFEAKRAKGAEPEGPPIISMRRMVVGDDGDGHFADGEAFRAKGLRPELMCASLGPDGAAVPGRRIALGPISPGHGRQDSR
jgi:hypothetical protein